MTRTEVETGAPLACETIALFEVGVCASDEESAVVRAGEVAGTALTTAVLSVAEVWPAEPVATRAVRGAGVEGSADPLKARVGAGGVSARGGAAYAFRVPWAGIVRELFVVGA